LLQQGGTISVQVLNEFAHIAHRKLKRRWPDIVEALAALRVLFPDPQTVSLAAHQAAVSIAERYGVALYLEAGCSSLLSEDMHNGRVIEGRLMIRNPFAWPATSR
jgi:predicted nucleic acid-binding protein